MKALRILILVLFIPVFASAVLADVTDQGGNAARTTQISSSVDNLDLPCDKLKNISLSGNRPPSAERDSTGPGFFTEVSAARATFLVLLPFSFRAPPLD